MARWYYEYWTPRAGFGAVCYGFKANQIGKVDPIESIGTDRHRLDSYTARRLGICTAIERVGWRKSFSFVIAQPGNSDRGRSGPRYGTDLSDEDKRALIEYMKTP